MITSIQCSPFDCWFNRYKRLPRESKLLFKQVNICYLQRNDSRLNPAAFSGAWNFHGWQTSEKIREIALQGGNELWISLEPEGKPLNWIHNGTIRSVQLHLIASKVLHHYCCYFERDQRTRSEFLYACCFLLAFSRQRHFQRNQIQQKRAETKWQPSQSGNSSDWETGRSIKTKVKVKHYHWLITRTCYAEITVPEFN